ncbi:MAG: hypothetical protein GY722_16675 [bacterium]|nr:hypothetical protein [bacterium]
MHRNRLLALAGVIIGIIGLFMKSLNTSTADGVPAEIAGAVNGFADIVPTIWGGLDTWAQWVLVALIIVVVVLAVRPDLATPLNRNDSMIVGGIGVVLLVYAVIKWMDAGDKADLASAGLMEGGIPAELFSIGQGTGFVVLIVGTVLVTFAGAMGFITRDE